MKTKQIHTAVLTIAAVAAATLLSGCGATSGYKQADKTGAGIASFRDEIVQGSKAIDATLKSLGAVATTANSDPRPAFSQYTKDVSNLESTAAKIRKRGQSMSEAGDAYFKQWEQELAAVTNPEIRDLAEKRKAKLQEAFKNIRTLAEPLKAKFDPWMGDLKDLQKYLSNDLTVEGVDTAKSLFAKTTSEGANVKKDMDALVAELNTIAATLTPSKVEKK